MIYSVKTVFVLFFIIVNHVRALPFPPINNQRMGLNPFNTNLNSYFGNLQANNNFINTLSAGNINGYGTNFQLNRQSDSGLNVGSNMNYDNNPSQDGLSQQQNYYNNRNIQQYYPDLNAQNDVFQTKANDATQLRTSTSISDEFSFTSTTSSPNTSSIKMSLVKEKDKVKNESKREHENDNEANYKHKHALKSTTKTKFFFQFQTVVPEGSRKINKETVYYLE